MLVVKEYQQFGEIGEIEINMEGISLAQSTGDIQQPAEMNIDEKLAVLKHLIYSSLKITISSVEPEKDNVDFEFIYENQT